MFRIESPYYFAFLIGIPLLIILSQFLIHRSNQLWKKLGNQDILSANFKSQSKNIRTKQVLIFLTYFFLVITIANPQYGLKKQKVKSQTAEIMIALDISQSMMAEDIKPNRLSRAKLWIKQFTDRFQGSKIGLISFAGNAYLQSPITSDAASINLLSSISDPQLASTQGTSLSAAIDLAIKSFSTQEGHHKLLLLITDGEDHEGEAVEEARRASNAGISIVCLPIGTEQGSPIPITYNNTNDVKRDKEGKVVYTKPNLKLLSEVSSAADGMVLDLNQGDQVFEYIQEKVKSILKKETSIQAFNEFESYYQIPLLLAIFCLLGFIYFKEKEKSML